MVALEGAFQGGSLGEVSGAKLTAALDLACADSERGIPTAAVLLLETGGVRLQEANLGLAAIAEIMASILALRRHAPVISVVAGTVGCFGGMSLAAGLSSYIVMTREARLGLNGPEVIEQESGIDEFDSSDRALIWAINGGEQRYATGLADALVEDDTQQVGAAIRGFIDERRANRAQKLTSSALSQAYPSTRPVAAIGPQRRCARNGSRPLRVLRAEQGANDERLHRSSRHCVVPRAHGEAPRWRATRGPY